MEKRTAPGAGEPEGAAPAPAEVCSAEGERFKTVGIGGAGIFLWIL